MKSKRGFTLLELLAIIVILAIIAVITVPIILDIIEDSHKSAALDSAYGYKDAVSKWYVSKFSQDNDYKLTGTYKVKNGKFNNEDIPLSGQNPSNGKLVYENNVLKSGCLTFEEYKVTFENGKVSTVEKGECTSFQYVDSDNSGTLTQYDIVSFGDEQFYVLEPENSNGNMVLLAKTCLINDNDAWRQVSSQEGSSSCSNVKLWTTSTPYWSTVDGLKSNYAYDINGNPASFSGNPYPYVYYVKGSDTNEIIGIVDSYVGTYVYSLSENAKGRLLSYEEALGLSDSVRGLNVFYWLGSAVKKNMGSRVGSNNSVSSCYSDNIKIRPVIEIPVADL